MTSGRGIVHAEYPRPENEAEMTQHGLQLWTTLPRALKSMAPRYQRIEASDIPVVVVGDSTVNVIAGEFARPNTPQSETRVGPANVLMPTLLWYISIAPDARFVCAIPSGFELGAYVGGGRGGFSPGLQRVERGALVVYADAPAAEGETQIEIDNTGKEPLEVMLLGGAPAEGPLVFHGPFVMNSVEDVRAAEQRYLTGQMGAL
jgi:redox-sensitive bicupin YhaK (pirin superfamily)